jgi:DNA (cytosine-5)-methyltransferase 1
VRVLDLFSGIGGFSLGLERTGGFRTVGFCEIDPYCRAVIAKHWPEIPIYGDICALTAETVADAQRAQRGPEREARRAGGRELLPQGQESGVWTGGCGVDVICGGFPCQDISVAGKGAGLAGARSGLWREYHRLIRELRPRYVIVENVAALLGRGLGEVLGDLASIGYDAEWHCIPASYVGAPHRRDRVWIIAYHGSQQHQSAGDENEGSSAEAAVAYPESRVRQRWASGETGHAALSGQDVAYATGLGREMAIQHSGGSAKASGIGKATLPGSGSPPTGADPQIKRLEGLEQGGPEKGPTDRPCDGSDSGWWSIEPDVRGVADGLPKGLDGEIDGSQRMDSVASALGLPEDRLRSVWRGIAIRSASQGSQPDEQLARELADRMPDLSHALALARGQEGLAAASRFMLRMRQAVEALGALPDASQPTASAWLSLPYEAAERAYLAACGRADWEAGEWAGVGRVALKVSNRADRLKGLGNAIVPQIAEIIGKAIMQQGSYE